jgi:demethylmenaquinone methyltransferase / 2-methoxy-6-polyprenyl-1,4-benzoquinol methylase
LTHLIGDDRARYVQAMFSQIAPRYDLMNRLMTFSQDAAWRREVIRRAGLPADGWLLDLGAGTGDLSAGALRHFPHSHVVAADFTAQMMMVGQARYAAQPLNWTCADALALPYEDDCFDAVISGFLLRNVPDIDRSLAEQWRVLKPGGRIVALDTTPPASSLLSPFIRFHLHTIIPTLGRWITGQAEAYRYLPASTVNFLQPERLAARMIEQGFQQVGFSRYMFGAIAIHWGVKN